MRNRPKPASLRRTAPKQTTGNRAINAALAAGFVITEHKADPNRGRYWHQLQHPDGRALSIDTTLGEGRFIGAQGWSRDRWAATRLAAQSVPGLERLLAAGGVAGPASEPTTPAAPSPDHTTEEPTMPTPAANTENTSAHDPVPAILDDNFFLYDAGYELQRVYCDYAGRSIRIRVRRDCYKRQSYAIAEGLTPALTWTHLAEQSPVEWHADSPYAYDGGSVSARSKAEALVAEIADDLVLRAIEILPHA